MSDYEQAVRTWTEHLRRRGSTPWTTWRELPDLATRPAARGPLPGAASLELVRRLAIADRAADVPLDGDEGREVGYLTRLADLALTRGGAGRGAAEHPLDWPGGTPRTVGPPPVDPAAVPTEELLRQAAGLLAGLLAPGAEPVTGEDGEPLDEEEGDWSGWWWGRPRRRPWTRCPAYELAGPPLTTARVREALRVRGCPPGGRRPTAIVLVEPLERMLQQVWALRVQGGAAVRWAGFVRRTLGREGLPPSIDAAALARHWAERVGPERVQVVVVPDPAAALSATAAVLGVPADPPAGWRAPRLLFADHAPPDLAPAGVEVMRRVNAVLGVRVSEHRRAEVTRDLVSHLSSAEDGWEEEAESSGDRRPLTRGIRLPPAAHDAGRARAERLADELADGGYRVHGDLTEIAASRSGTPTRPPLEEALGLVLEALLDPVHRHVVPTEEEK